MTWVFEDTKLPHSVIIINQGYCPYIRNIHLSDLQDMLIYSAARKLRVGHTLNPWKEMNIIKISSAIGTDIPVTVPVEIRV